MLGIQVVAVPGVVGRVASAIGTGSDRMAVPSALRIGIAILGPGFQQNTTLLGAIWGRRSQTASDGSQSPFLNIGLNENEAGLAKVDMDDCGTVGADGWEEVLRLEAVDYLVEFLAVAGEEDGTGAGTISDANNVALD